ncbi:phage integrase family protein [Serratia fonticola]|nr:phage integrase family protein [Serratia fonticola]
MSPCTAYLLTSFVDHFVLGHPQKINIWFRSQLTSAQYVVYRAGPLLLSFPVLCRWPLRELLQNSCSDTSQGLGYLLLDIVRSMRDYAAQLGAGLPKYLLAPEVAVLLSYFDGLTRRMFFDTLWNTSARLNEALALRPGDFELEPSRKYPQLVVAIRDMETASNRSQSEPRTDINISAVYVAPG